MENFEGGKFRSSKRRWKEFGLEDGTVGPRVDTCYGAETRESIHQDQHGAPRAWYSWQAPFYRVEAPFRWVGSEGRLLVELNVAHEGVGEVYATWGRRHREGCPQDEGQKRRGG